MGQLILVPFSPITHDSIMQVYNEGVPCAEIARMSGFRLSVIMAIIKRVKRPA
jgi:hypothetical protein